METPHTSIATSTADTITVRGRDLIDDLVGHVSFTEMIYFQLRGEMPTPTQRGVLNAVMVCLMEHGLTPSSIATRMIYSSAPEALQAAVAGGLLGAGSVFLGSMEGTAKLLHDGVQLADDGGSTEEYCREVVAEHRAARRPLPGFGHHIHRPDDPRSARLLEVAHELGAQGPHARLLIQLAAEVDRQANRHLTINATGATGAVLADIGIPWQSVRGFALIARCAGLVGHAAEEAETPSIRAIWAAADEAVPYEWSG
ncbi:MAG: citryl-CoA lyase [Actinomycetota bacterium]|mgnify:CR=1 FL=1